MRLLKMSFIRPIALALLVTATVAGCGGGSSHPATSTPAASATTTSDGDEAVTTGPAPVTLPGASSPAAFAWLHPGPVPSGWKLARLPDRAVLAYPSSWQQVHSDPQTLSAARTDARTGLIVQYLNATPQQGRETLENWSTFRPGHNQEEGDSHIQVIAAARDLRFRDGTGSCVIDRYATPRTTYQEIACLIDGPHGGNVIVAATQPDRWAQDATTLERAVSAFVA